MLEMLITSSALILLLTLLRLVLKKRFSPRLRYALWLLVALRLLIPGSLFSLPFSLPALAEESGLNEAVEEVRYAPEVIHTVGSNSSGHSPEEYIEQVEGTPWFQDAWDSTEPVKIIHAEEAYGENDPDTPVMNLTVETYPDHFKPLKWVWYGGMALMALWFLFTNLRFRIHLKKNALPADVDAPLPVRVAPGLISPCLCGLIRPVIYVTPTCLADESRLRHVIAHEYTHFRQGDQFWSLVRCACLVVWWFNPLVWLAAALSRRDCELACDEGALARLGEGERIPYGRTLVDMVAATQSPAALLHTATTMTGGKKSISERVSLIAKRPKMTIFTLITVAVLVVFAAACAFGGAEGKEDKTPQSGFTTIEDTFGATYRMAGHNPGTDILRPAAISYSPTARSIGDITITRNFFGCLDADRPQLDWGTNITDPVYREIDFDLSAYCSEGIPYYPDPEEFFAGYEVITVYEIENADTLIHLLLLDGELWMAYNLRQAAQFVLRLTEAEGSGSDTESSEPPAEPEQTRSLAEEYLLNTPEEDILAFVLPATYPGKEFSTPAQLNSYDLFTIAAFSTDYTAWYDEGSGTHLIPVTDLTTILDGYFEDYTFNPADTGWGRYDPAAGIHTAYFMDFNPPVYSLIELTAVNGTTFRAILDDPYTVGVTVTVEITEEGPRIVSCVNNGSAEEIAQTIYGHITGGDFFYMDIYTDTTETRIRMTAENSWNLPSDLSGYEWAHTTSQGSGTAMTIRLSSPDGKTELRCFHGSDRVRLMADGKEYYLTANKNGVEPYEAALFNCLRWVAEDALTAATEDIVIDGFRLSDADNTRVRFEQMISVVNRYAEQRAENLNALPDWMESKPLETVVAEISAGQAYFGEGTENFCGGYSLLFKLEDANRSPWQAGSGLEEVTEGPYAGWWKWSIGASFAHNADGDWVCTGHYTGGESLAFPTRLEEASMAQLVDYYYHTTGFAHSYSIPYAICRRPAEEAEELDRLLNGQEDPDTLCRALGAFLRDYGSYDDLRLNYEVLSSALEGPLLTGLNEGYLG